jgi:hypothetical protein
MSLPLWKRVTASKGALLTVCQAWAKDDARWENDYPKTEASFGHEFHANMELAINLGERIVAHADPRMMTLVQRGYEWIDFALAKTGNGARAEVPLAWDLSTDKARTLPSNGQRDYTQATPTELCGTADIILLTPDGTLHIYDWKTGNDLSYARDQLRTLAVLGVKRYRAKRCVIAALKVDENGVEEVGREELDAFDVEVIAEGLRQYLSAIPTSEPNPGAHCFDFYCPHRVHCPATTKAIAELIPATALVRKGFPLSMEIQSPEHAAYMLPLVDLAMDAAEKIRDQLKEYARGLGGLPLPNGKVWKEIPSTRSSVDGKGALALAEKLGADPNDLAACMKSMVVKSFRVVNAKGKAA